MIIAMNDKVRYTVLMDLETFIEKTDKVQQAILEGKNGIEYVELLEESELLGNKILEFCDNVLHGYVCFKPTTRDLANIRELKKELLALRKAIGKYKSLRMLAPLQPEIKTTGNVVINGLSKVRQVAHVL